MRVHPSLFSILLQYGETCKEDSERIVVRAQSGSRRQKGSNLFGTLNTENKIRESKYSVRGVSRTIRAQVSRIRHTDGPWPVIVMGREMQ